MAARTLLLLLLTCALFVGRPFAPPASGAALRAVSAGAVAPSARATRTPRPFPDRAADRVAYRPEPGVATTGELRRLSRGQTYPLAGGDGDHGYARLPDHFLRSATVLIAAPRFPTHSFRSRDAAATSSPRAPPFPHAAR